MQWHKGRAEVAALEKELRVLIAGSANIRKILVALKSGSPLSRNERLRITLIYQGEDMIQHGPFVEISERHDLEGHAAPAEAREREGADSIAFMEW